jgi:hypothetical protein
VSNDRICTGLIYGGFMETAGIEPASAVAQEMASTSVAGAQISLSGRLAGGVSESQLPGWSSDRREQILTELAH